MDEFQRFTELLDGREDNVVSRLVQKLTSYRNGSTNEEVRMLLLSATPYRHLTLDTDGREGDAAHISTFASEDESTGTIPMVPCKERPANLDLAEFDIAGRKTREADDLVAGLVYGHETAFF